MYRILDLDNCIADDAWRLKHIEWHLPASMARYERYHRACFGDQLGNRHLIDHPNIIICTGRPISVRKTTQVWLHTQGVRYRHLLMRNNTDLRRSVDLKRVQVQWLEADYGIPPTAISSAFDDHPDVVAMYRTLGIPAERAVLHQLTAYKGHS